MTWPRVLVLVLALTACTSGSTPTTASTTAAGSPASAALPTSKPTAVDENYGTSQPSYRPLRSNEPLTGFAPTSVTFVSTRTGWFLGHAECGKEMCGVLLQTRDAGRTFIRRTAPPASVGGVRFADLREGWAFGDGTNGSVGTSGLWRTHDGGVTWRQLGTHAVRSLEVGSGRVWAVDAGADGTAPEVLRGDTRTDPLRPVFQAPNRAATVVVGHGTAYVVAQSIAGPIATTLWAMTPTSTHQRRHPCTSGEPRALQLAVGQAHDLVAICSGEPGVGNQVKHAFASTDDGRTWQRRPDPPEYGYTGGNGTVAATSTRAFMTGSRNEIHREVGAGPWRAVLDNEGIGFEYLGFTDETHGVALGSGSAPGAWMTEDAGEHWRRLQFR